MDWNCLWRETWKQHWRRADLIWAWGGDGMAGLLEVMEATPAEVQALATWAKLDLADPEQDHRFWRGELFDQLRAEIEADATVSAKHKALLYAHIDDLLT